jgi:type II secretory pathway predicted ATPase ExeA
MYEHYYGLKERPFDLTPNPRFLYLTARHREALSNLRYGISGRKGVTLLIGEAGTGKTTLIRATLEEHQDQRIHIVTVSNPTLSRSEFFEFLAARFGLSQNAANSKSRFLFELDRLLIERHERGEVTALIVDESQSLPDELLEEVRLLANHETSTEKLLPVVLVGQPELADRLNQPGLRQLKQRIALRCVLTPLSLRETAAYISTRLRIASGEIAQIFTREAVAAIHECSGGVPRSISVICDNALLSGFAMDQRPVGRDVVMDVAGDFDLRPGAAPVIPQEPRAAVTAVGDVARSRTPVPAARPAAAVATFPNRAVPPAAPSVRPAAAAVAEPPRVAAPVKEEGSSGPELFAYFRRRRRFSFF